MKVWEKIAKEMTKQLNHEYTTKDAVKGDMYMMRITPCDVNMEYGYVGGIRMNAICDKSDCYACLDKYLDLEVAHET
jgi:hypothetical protein